MSEKKQRVTMLLDWSAHAQQNKASCGLQYSCNPVGQDLPLAKLIKACTVGDPDDPARGHSAAVM
jgi:hypothetical protein